MPTVIWGGKPTETKGPELKAGDKAPSDFTLAANNLAPVTGKELAGKPRVIVALPSLDTAVCDRETRRFNEEAAKLPGVEVVVVSMDLPFAQKRWCGAAGIDKVRTLSDYNARTFGPAYGVLEPNRGLLVRAVFVVDAKDTIRHVEYVKDVGTEPAYDAALQAARDLG